jgi:hypothetical protein
VFAHEKFIFPNKKTFIGVNKAENMTENHTTPTISEFIQNNQSMKLFMNM